MSTLPRSAEVQRKTKETDISLSVDLEGDGGRVDVSTGIPFFDHMLAQLGRHGGFDLRIDAKGDLDVDTHHTVEDTGIALGEALSEALGDRAGVRRFASLSVPLDEALIDVALDLSGRPYLAYAIDFAPDTPKLGEPGVRTPASRGVLAGLRGLCRNHASHRNESRQEHPSHPRGLLQGRGPGSARRHSGGGHRYPLDQGVALSARQASIAVLDYGIGNLRSAEKALQHVGADARLTSDPADARSADAVVLPGVGSFGPCARALRRSGLDEVALEAIAEGKPFLGHLRWPSAALRGIGRGPRGSGLGGSRRATSPACQPG